METSGEESTRSMKEERTEGGTEGSKGLKRRGRRVRETGKSRYSGCVPSEY